MGDLGDMILALGVLVALASLGLGTLLALGLMALLGLVSEWSFRRIFFLSFGLALLVPVLLGGALVGVLQDEEVRSEISAELRDALPAASRPTDESLDFDRAEEDGTLSQSEQEARLEDRLQRIAPGAEVAIDENGIRITTRDDSVTIDID
ncbi:hypothetical protein [Qipengyuania nanhaisediminis]|uniref:hypothetical protein n=1 Tax=Qipengyuania nanhaisediminis TaxID=604088 RepID=UPI0038B28149